MLAILVGIIGMFLFGGASYADKAQSAAQSTDTVAAEAQSVNTTAQSSGEAQSSNIANTEQSSSGSSVATAATSDDKPASCTPRNISPEEIQTDFKTSDGSSDITAYEAVEFAISLTLEEGHCAGDGAVITVPSELGTDGSFDPIPMTTPDGVTIGIATYHPDRTVSIKLTSEVENRARQNYHASAWWKVHMEPSLVPGETRELRWTVDGVIRRQSIQVGTCDGCSQPGPNPSKWGSVSGSEQHVTIVLPTASHDGQVFTITDTLTSSGQSFNCDRLLTGRIGVYSEAGPWGQPTYVRFEDPVVTSCTSDKATVSVKLNQGEKARFELNVGVDPTDPGPWSDSAVITSQGESWEVTARVTRRESGGNAGFDNTPSPAPTPEPSPVPTPSTPPVPTPTPSVTTPAPSPTSSTSPEPSPSAPSPSATPTPSPSTTPEPAPTPSTTPESTPSVTPTPTPSTTPRQFRLPVTGAAGSGAIGSAVALLTAGVATLWVRRRQTTHYSED